MVEITKLHPRAPKENETNGELDDPIPEARGMWNAFLVTLPFWAIVGLAVWYFFFR